VFFSFSTADEDFHSPNEFFRVHRLHEGLEAWTRYWESYGPTVRTVSAHRRSRAPVP